MITFRYYGQEDSNRLFIAVRDLFYIDYGVKFNTVNSFEKYLSAKLDSDYHDFFEIYNDNACIGCLFTFSFNADSKCAGMKIYLKNGMENYTNDTLNICLDLFAAKYSIRKLFLFSCVELQESEKFKFKKIAVFGKSTFINGQLSDSYCYELEVSNV